MRNLYNNDFFRSSQVEISNALVLGLEMVGVKMMGKRFYE